MTSKVFLGFFSIILVLCGVLLTVYFYCIRMPGNRVVTATALTVEEQQLQSRLAQHVRVLAEEIGERHYQLPEKLNQAADYLRSELQTLGYELIEQRFAGGQYTNVVVEIRGRSKPDEILIAGAHYDTTWMTPGADDNASGVAGLLELARLLKDKEIDRTIRLVAFANEEAPFFGTQNMGAIVSAQQAKDLQENIVVMYSLEMIGYFLDQPNTQQYPHVIKHFYPDTANFIAFVANLPSATMLRKSVKLFRQDATIGSAGLIAPAKLVPDIQRSDHYAYWLSGFPAVMVTDTANFRNPHYHTVADVPATLNYANMARVVSGLASMLEKLAQSP